MLYSAQGGAVVFECVPQPTNFPSLPPQPPYCLMDSLALGPAYRLVVRIAYEQMPQALELERQVVSMAREAIRPC